MIIFSAMKSDRSHEENVLADRMARDTMKDNFQVMAGVYKEDVEVSYITRDTELGRKLARDYRQETYLERGHRGFWYLVETKTDKVIDWYQTIREVSEEEARKHDSYSILDGRFYLGVKA